LNCIDNLLKLIKPKALKPKGKKRITFYLKLDFGNARSKTFNKIRVIKLMGRLTLAILSTKETHYSSGITFKNTHSQTKIIYKI